MENRLLQMKVLSDLRESGDIVPVILRNGYRMEGSVLGFDDTVVLLSVGGKRKLVYTHMISTIAIDSAEVQHEQ